MYYTSANSNDKVGQYKFTVYRHKVLNFACGLAVIIQIKFQTISNKEELEILRLSIEITEAPPSNYKCSVGAAKKI